MTMIGPERKPVISAALGLPTTLFGQQRFHHAVHIHIACQVVGFVKTTRIVALRSP